MKRILLSLLVVASVVSSCGNKPKEVVNDKYVIVGELTDTIYEGTKVYLQKMSDTWNKRRSVVGIDTTIVENGTFKFEGTMDTVPVMRFITIGENAPGGMQRAILVLEPDTIKITQQGDGFIPSGTELNKIIPQVNELVKKMTTLPDSECAPFVYDFIKKNMTNVVGEHALITSAYYLNAEQLNEVLELAKPEFKNSTFGQVFVKRNNALQATVIGKQFTDIKGNTPDGKAIALSDYAGKGKYVLVDFWASWCPPCRADMPLLVKAYAKYKNKGFEIVGVSLDDEKEKWEKGISDLKITWPQMSDLKGWESELSGAYGISSIPSTVLLDKDGKIIAKNIEGHDLDAKLAELLK